MGILTELADHLVAQGVTGTIFEGRYPDTPDALLVLFETPGGAILPSLVDTVELRSVQLRSRALKYTDAQSKCELAYRILHGISEQTIGGARYVLIEAKQPPFSLGDDARARAEFACNLRVLRRNPDR